MQLSTKGRYAVMAMAELARGEPARATPLAAIAERQQISRPYLEQLFSRLRRRGLVESVRGPGGGYRLSRPAAETSVADVVTAVDEPLRATRCSGGTRRLHEGRRALPHPRSLGRNRQAHPRLSGGGLAGRRGHRRHPRGEARAMNRTYLDYNATAPVRPEAIAAVAEALGAVGNPSSVHAAGSRGAGAGGSRPAARSPISSAPSRRR